MAVLPLEQGANSLRIRARIARGFVLAYLAIASLKILVLLGEAGGLIDLTRLEPDGPALAAALVDILYFFLLLGSVIAVAIWIYRAHANLRDAGYGGLSFTPGWAVGWYFVPFANLFKPQEAMNELWVMSTAGTEQESENGYLGYWWGAWIVGNILSNLGARLGTVSESELSAFGHVLDALGHVVLVLAALLLARIMQKVTDAQQSMGVAQVFE